MNGRRVLYLQFTNPAGYPPIVHSSQILAEHGCSIVMLGIAVTGHGLTIPPHPRVRVRSLRPAAGWLLKLKYAWFVAWATLWACVWRPDWIYASDAIATPVTRWLQLLGRWRVIYHEHDAPAEADSGVPRSAFMRLVLGARQSLIRAADLCVVPSNGRVAVLDPARIARRVDVVWNCPRREEAHTARPVKAASSQLRVLFQGSIVPARLPLVVIDAIARVPQTRLVVIGYETAGHRGFVGELMARARRLGIEDRVTHVGPVPRHLLLDHSSQCDVGLALFPITGADGNESSMVGASNKPFEYLACGLPLIVSKRAEWIETFVEAGLALSADPTDVDSLATALTWYVTHADERVAMGERGRQRVAADWNYERCFEPVLRTIVDGVAPSRVVAAPPSATGVRGSGVSGR